MRISDTEKKVLFKEKMINGKSVKEADAEIKRDIEFVNNLGLRKKDVKKLHTIIKNQRIQIEKYYQQLKKLKSKKFNERLTGKLKEITDAGTDYYANTKQLSRIISLIEVEKKMGLGDLTKTCCLKPKIAKNALNFLLRINFISQNTEGRGKIVFVHNDWNKLKEFADEVKKLIRETGRSNMVSISDLNNLIIQHLR